MIKIDQSYLINYTFNIAIMVLISAGQEEDEGGQKYDEEMHKIQISQDEPPYSITACADKKNDQRWAYIGGRDEYRIYPLYASRVVSDAFVMWLLMGASDFAVSANKYFMPPKKTWILKNFNRKDIVSKTSSFLKFKNIINGLAPSGNKWDSNDLGSFEIKGTQVRYKDQDDLTDDDEKCKGTFLFGKSENKNWYIKHLNQPEHTYERQNIRRVSSKLKWKPLRMLWVRIDLQ